MEEDQIRELGGDARIGDGEGDGGVVGNSVANAREDEFGDADVDAAMMDLAS